MNGNIVVFREINSDIATYVLDVCFLAFSLNLGNEKRKNKIFFLK